MGYFVKVLLQHEQLFATIIGSMLAAFFGIVSGIVLLKIRSKQENKKAVIVIASELSRIINWHEQLLNYQDEDRPFEIWGMFLPINSFGQHRAIMKKSLDEADFRDLEDAYIRFSTYDRQMQSVVQAWSSSGHETPRGPALRWRNLFWESICQNEIIELVERLRTLLKKLDDISTK